MQTTGTLQNIINQKVISSLDISKAAVVNTSKTAKKALAQVMTQKSFIDRDMIIPILKKKCYNCLSATKKKDGLRLDTEEFMREGGKTGSILTVSNPENSPIYTALLLPEDDDNHMPPKGKPQLTP